MRRKAIGNGIGLVQALMLDVQHGHAQARRQGCQERTNRIGAFAGGAQQQDATDRSLQFAELEFIATVFEILWRDGFLD